MAVNQNTQLVIPSTADIKVYQFQKQSSEVSVKQVFLKISQNLQENTCVIDSFLIQLQPQTSGGCFYNLIDFLIKCNIFY